MSLSPVAQLTIFVENKQNGACLKEKVPQNGVSRMFPEKNLCYFSAKIVNWGTDDRDTYTD